MTYKYTAIGSRLKELRKEMGYSLAAVAEACGIQQYQTVSSWENENTAPSLKNLFQLCELYGCELGYLIGEYDCKTRRNADIKEEIGLSETVINQLRAYKAFNPPVIDAVNLIIEFDNGSLIENISKFIFHNFNGSVQVGNVTIDGSNIADVFLLEIINELKTIRTATNGGAE